VPLCLKKDYVNDVTFDILQPKVVTAIDEADLARRMERAEMENAEVSGDEDESDNEEGMKFDGDAGENNTGDKDSNKSGSDED